MGERSKRFSAGELEIRRPNQEEPEPGWDEGLDGMERMRGFGRAAGGVVNVYATFMTPIMILIGWAIIAFMIVEAFAFENDSTGRTVFFGIVGLGSALTLIGWLLLRRRKSRPVGHV